MLLHFQAVDYEATVWGNGAETRRVTRGGFTPFCCVLPDADEVTLVVRARDLRNEVKPCGKTDLLPAQQRLLQLYPNHRHLADGVG